MWGARVCSLPCIHPHRLHPIPRHVGEPEVAAVKDRNGATNLASSVIPRQVQSTLVGTIHRELGEGRRMKALKIIVEKHPDGFVAYPLGLKGVVVGEGNTYHKAMTDVKSAIRFHIETFGKQAL